MAFAIIFLAAPSANAGLGNAPEGAPRNDPDPVPGVDTGNFVACLGAGRGLQCVQNLVLGCLAATSPSTCVLDYLLPGGGITAPTPPSGAPCAPDPATLPACASGLVPAAPPGGAPCAPDPATLPACVQGLAPPAPGGIPPGGVPPGGVPPGGVPPGGVPPCTPDPANPTGCAPPAPGTPALPATSETYGTSPVLRVRSSFDDGSRIVSFATRDGAARLAGGLAAGAPSQDLSGVRTRFHVTIENVGTSPVDRIRVSIPGAFPNATAGQPAGWSSGFSITTLPLHAHPPATNAIAPAAQAGAVPGVASTDFVYVATGAGLAPGASVTFTPSVLGLLPRGEQDVRAAYWAGSAWLTEPLHAGTAPKPHTRFMVLYATDVGLDVRDEDGDPALGMKALIEEGALASGKGASATAQDSDNDGLILIPTVVPPYNLTYIQETRDVAQGSGGGDVAGHVQNMALNWTVVDSAASGWANSNVVPATGLFQWPAALERGLGFVAQVAYPLKVTLADETGRAVALPKDKLNWVQPGTAGEPVLQKGNAYYWPRTDASGAYPLTILADGYVPPAITNPGFADVRPTATTPPRAQLHVALGTGAPRAGIIEGTGPVAVRGLEFPLKTGTILDEAGLPYERADGDVLAFLDSATGEAVDVTPLWDEATQKYVVAIPDGTYDVTLSHVGFLPARVNGLTVAAATGSAEVDFVGENGLKYPARVGTVATEFGDATGVLAGDALTFDPAGPTVVAGSFIRAQPGTYTVTLAREGFEPASATLTLPADATAPVVIDFTGEAALVANVRVLAVESERGVDLLDVAAFTLDAGEPIDQGLVGGVYAIAVPAEAGAVVAAVPGYLPKSLARASELSFTGADALAYTVKVANVESELGTDVAGVAFFAGEAALDAVAAEGGAYYVPHPDAALDLVAAAPGYLATAFDVPASAEQVLVDYSPAATSGAGDAAGLAFRLKITVADELGSALTGASVARADGEALVAVPMESAIYVAAGDGVSDLSLPLVVSKAGYLDAAITATGAAGEQATAAAALQFPVTFDVTDIAGIAVASLDGVTFRRGDDPSSQTAISPSAVDGGMAYFTQEADDQWYTIEKAGYRNVGAHVVLSEGSFRGVFIPLEHTVRILVGAAGDAPLAAGDVTFTRDGAATTPERWIGLEAFFADADAAGAVYALAAPEFVDATLGPVGDNGIANAIAPLVPEIAIEVADEIGGAVADASLAATTTATREAPWTIAASAPGMIGDAETLDLEIGAPAAVALTLAYPVHVGATFLGATLDLDAIGATFERGAGGDLAGIEPDALQGATAYFRGTGETLTYRVDAPGLLGAEVEDDPAAASRHYVVALGTLAYLRAFNASLSPEEGALVDATFKLTRLDDTVLTLSPADSPDGRVAVPESLAAFPDPIPLVVTASGYSANETTLDWTESAATTLDVALARILVVPVTVQVTGVVRAEGSGAAVPGAAIRLSGSGGVFDATTGEDGSFAIDDVDLGEYTLRVARVNFVTKSLTITVAADATAFDVTLNRASDGVDPTPSPNAIAEAADSVGAGCTVGSDACKLVFNAELRYNSSWDLTIAGLRGEPGDTFTLRAGTDGPAIDALAAMDGRELDHVNVTFPASALTATSSIVGKLNRVGTWTLLRDGDLWGYFVVEPQPITVAFDRNPTEAGTSVTVRAIVTDAASVPLAGASVDFSALGASATALTDGDGVAAFTGALAVGSYTISASRDVADDAAPEFTGAATLAVVEAGSILPDPTTARDVVYLATGCPDACTLTLSAGDALAYGDVADLFVANLTGAVGDEWLLTPPGGGDGVGFLAVADPDHEGRVAIVIPSTQITLDRAGTWTLAGMDASTSFTVAPLSRLGVTVSPASYTGPADGTLAGTVTVRDGEAAVEGARVRLNEIGYGGLAVTLADGTYLFSIAEVPAAGTYTIRAEKDLGGSTDPEIVGSATYTVTIEGTGGDPCTGESPPPECEGGGDPCATESPPPECGGEEPVFGVTFSFTPTTPRATEAITFTGAATNGLPSSWSWTFGDGGTGTGSPAVHAFAAPGTYTVTLTAATAAGATASFPRTITIAAAPSTGTGGGDSTGGCSGQGCNGNEQSNAVPLAQPSTPAVRIVTTSSVAVTWTTTGAGTSSVEYGIVEPFTLTTGSLPNGAPALVEISGLTPGKTFGFVVKATNSLGVVSRSSTTWVTMPTSIATTPPEITFLAPTDGASVKVPAQVSVLVADADGVKSARLLIDGVEVASGKGSLSFAWAAIATGPHSLRVEAEDALGAKAARTITVQGPAAPKPPTPAPPTTPPAPTRDPGVIVSVPQTVSAAEREVRAIVRTVDLGSDPTITFLVDDAPAAARKDGDAWLVTIPELAPGEHRVEVRAVAATGENAGARATFTIAEPLEPAALPSAPESEPETQSERGFLGIPAPGLLALLALLGAVAIVLGRKR